MILAQAISRVVSFCHTHRKTQAFPRVAACAVLAAVFVSPPLALATTVRMVLATNTATLGAIDIELYDDQAPKTVANFLLYAGRGAYNTTIIHRHTTVIADGIAVIQGGGYAFIPPSYYYDFPNEPPIQNEFSPLRRNVRGTIAMAKLGGNPDSATSEWFINLDDSNSTALDNTSNNGGYTVFGHVLDPGMSVVDTIASYTTQSAYLSVISQGIVTPVLFGWLPIVNPTLGPQPENLVVVSRIPNVASAQTPSGALAIFTAGVNMTFNSAGAVDVYTLRLRLAEFKSPPNESLYFNNGMFALKLTGVMGSADDHVITLYDGATNRPTRYYAYGKTPDNQTDHWYDFSYDSVTGTGAEIVGNKILLHFVDGQRGDDDLTVNNSITHTGAQAVVTSTTSTDAQSGGCSIASTPSQTMRGGDWIVVSLFLAFVAFVRKRTHRQQL